MANKQIKVGDVVAWDKVPSGALVWSDGYATRQGDTGCWVALGTRGEGRMWESRTELEGIGEVWSWSSESGADATIIALDVPADATADDLRELAEVFEVREALRDGAARYSEVPERDPFDVRPRFWRSLVDDEGSLDAAADRLHRAGWRPGMNAGDAARLLAEAG